MQNEEKKVEKEINHMRWSYHVCVWYDGEISMKKKLEFNNQKKRTKKTSGTKKQTNKQKTGGWLKWKTKKQKTKKTKTKKLISFSNHHHHHHHSPVRGIIIEKCSTNVCTMNECINGIKNCKHELILIWQYFFFCPTIYWW